MGCLRIAAVAVLSFMILILGLVVVGEGIAAGRHANNPLHFAELTASYLGRWGHCLKPNLVYDSGRHYRFEIGMTMEEAAAIVERYYPAEFPPMVITFTRETYPDVNKSNNLLRTGEVKRITDDGPQPDFRVRYSQFPQDIDELLSIRQPEVRWWFTSGPSCALLGQAIELRFDDGMLTTIADAGHYGGP